MAVRRRVKEKRRLLPGAVHTGLRRIVLGTYGLVIVAAAAAAWASLVTWSVHDPSLNNATRIAPKNLLGNWGAVVADLSFQSIGLASIILFGSFLAYAVVDRILVKRRGGAELVLAVSEAEARRNDLISLGAGLALYVAFLFWLHPLLIGVSPLASG